MVIHEHKVNYNYGDSWKLKPIFDVHAGNIDCDIKAFKDYMKDSDEKTLFIGGGDLIDAIITRDIKRYRKSSDATIGDAIIDEQIEILRKILDPYSHQIIGLGEGNHEDNILVRCGTHPIKRLCKELNGPYLGYSALVRLVF